MSSSLLTASLQHIFIPCAGLFKIEAETGRLMVTRSLDREARDLYNVKIKAETYESRRSLGKREAIPSAARSSYHLGFDEALVVVHVTDENDNSPVFENKGKPIVAAVPLEATFGYQIARVSVRSPTFFNEFMSAFHERSTQVAGCCSGKFLFIMMSCLMMPSSLEPRVGHVMYFHPVERGRALYWSESR